LDLTFFKFFDLSLDLDWVLKTGSQKMSVRSSLMCDSPRTGDIYCFK